MKIITQTVSPDEACHGLFEGPKTRKDLLGRDVERWVQQCFVIRGDAIACWEKDYGPAEDFAGVTPLLMPSLGENSVAQLQYFAEKNRNDDYWTKRSEEMAQASTLIQDHIRQIEIDHEIIRNRSIFGPAISVQRGGYSHERAERKLMAKVDNFHGVGIWNRSRKR
ncbi:MAG: hypothetical protein U0990_12650 [Candidatus Nanopelagicales bacterium]|nr:hypothetical protein [Candidatus Nanopelagicales bacterium]